MDEWQVDVCVSGSQKGLMLPAGLGITCVSQKALAAAKVAKSRRCYFDYGDMVTTNANGYFPYTPSIPMLYGLRESLKMLAEEGLQNVLNRHSYLAGGVRAAVLEGWKLKLCATEPKWYSDTVSAVMVPRASTAQTSSLAPSSAITWRRAPGWRAWPASCSASATWATATN